MFGKTSFFKLVFVFAILGVLALAAVAPGVARAFFQNDGVSGFTRRLFGGESLETASVEGTSRQIAQDQASLTVLGGSITSLDETSTAGTNLLAEVSSDDLQTDAYFELTGTLEAVNGGLWMVDGFTVVVDASTEVKGTFTIGDLVKVEGMLQEDGSILAHQIKSPDADSSSGVDDGTGSMSQAAFTTPKFELVDLLNANTGELWKVGSWDVMVTAATERKGDLVVGALVKVEGIFQEDGSILAHEIKAVLFDESKQPGRVELVGLLDDTPDSMIWIVSGITVELTAMTEVKGTFAPGDPLKVEGMLQADGSVLAFEIEPAFSDGDDEDEDDSDDDDLQKGQKVEFTGVLSAMNGNTWVVNGVTVIVTTMTELEGPFEIGAMVKVEGYRVVDGSVEAHEIEAVMHDGDDDDGDYDDGDYDDGDYDDDDYDDDDDDDSDHDDDDDDDDDSDHDDDDDDDGDD